MIFIKGLGAALLGYLFSFYAIGFFFDSGAGPCDADNLSFDVVSSLAAMIYAFWGMAFSSTLFAGLKSLKHKYVLIKSVAVPFVLMCGLFGYSAWHKMQLTQLTCEQ